MMATVTKFRVKAAVHGKAPTTGATRIDILKSRLRLMFGRLLSRSGVAGFIQPVEVVDQATGDTLTVSVEPLFTRISISGRDYYFRRLSGKYDGSGSAL